jgi:hypothetical protein
LNGCESNLGSGVITGPNQSHHGELDRSGGPIRRLAPPSDHGAERPSGRAPDLPVFVVHREGQCSENTVEVEPCASREVLSGQSARLCISRGQRVELQRREGPPDVGMLSPIKPRREQDSQGRHRKHQPPDGELHARHVHGKATHAARIT